MPEQQLTTPETRELAADLLRQLEQRVGDREAIDALMRRWLDVLDVSGLSLVCMAAIQTTFADCMTEIPTADVPPGAVAFTPNERNSA
jgi:hypothetical protein